MFEMMGDQKSGGVESEEDGRSLEMMVDAKQEKKINERWERTVLSRD